VAVNGAEVAEAEFFEEGGRDDEVLGLLFGAGAEFAEGIAAGDFFEEAFEV